MNLKLSNFSFLLTIVYGILHTVPVLARDTSDLMENNLIQFNDNGAWCWYQNERLIIDTENGKLIFGSVASGVYFYSLNAGKQFSQTKKMLLIR